MERLFFGKRHHLSSPKVVQASLVRQVDLEEAPPVAPHDVFDVLTLVAATVHDVGYLQVIVDCIDLLRGAQGTALTVGIAADGGVQ